MSKPIDSLLLAIPVPSSLDPILSQSTATFASPFVFVRVVLFRRELRKDLGLFLQLLAEREDDLPFRVEATVRPALNPIDRQRRDARFARELRLRHEDLLSKG